MNEFPLTSREVIRLSRNSFSAYFLVTLISASAIFGFFVFPGINSAFGQGSVDVNSEYSSGTIGDPYGDLALWYAWVNRNGTQVLFLAYQSYLHRPPVTTFLGQRYVTESGEEAFVGSTLMALEVYNDTNGNGIPDFNRTFGLTTEGQTEVLYELRVNSSAGFEASPVTKTSTQGVPHYRWGMSYRGIDAFLESETRGIVATLTLERLDFSYDFCIEGNRSYVKTNFEIGKLMELEPQQGLAVSLDGLSLSLLYGTTVLSPKGYFTSVDGLPFDPKTSSTSSAPAALDEIKIENVTAYEFCFAQNYTAWDDLQSKNVQSLSTAAANWTLPWGSVDWFLVQFENVLRDVFPRISSINQPVSLDLDESSFLYRVCYPVWGGDVIEHDPVYVAHLSPEGAGSNSFQLAIFVTVISLVVLVVTVVYWEKDKPPAGVILVKNS